MTSWRCVEPKATIPLRAACSRTVHCICRKLSLEYELCQAAHEQRSKHLPERPRLTMDHSRDLSAPEAAAEEITGLHAGSTAVAADPVRAAARTRPSNAIKSPARLLSALRRRRPLRADSSTSGDDALLDRRAPNGCLEVHAVVANGGDR